MDKLTNICKRHGINYKQAKEMIVYDHLLNRVYKRKDLEELELDLSEDALALIDKWAKALRISRDAVLACGFAKLIKEIENGEI